MNDKYKNPVVFALTQQEEQQVRNFARSMGMSEDAEHRMVQVADLDRFNQMLQTPKVLQVQGSFISQEFNNYYEKLNLLKLLSEYGTGVQERNLQYPQFTNEEIPLKIFLKQYLTGKENIDKYKPP